MLRRLVTITCVAHHAHANVGMHARRCTYVHMQFHLKCATSVFTWTSTFFRVCRYAWRVMRSATTNSSIMLLLIHSLSTNYMDNLLAALTYVYTYVDMCTCTFRCRTYVTTHVQWYIHVGVCTRTCRTYVTTHVQYVSVCTCTCRTYVTTHVQYVSVCTCRCRCRIYMYIVSTHVYMYTCHLNSPTMCDVYNTPGEVENTVRRAWCTCTRP